MMAGLYIAAGVIPIVLYFLEVKKKSKSAQSQAPEGIIEDIEEVGKKNQKIQAQKQAKSSSMFTISAEGGFVTMNTSVGTEAGFSEDIKFEPEVPLESSLLNTVWESQVLTSSDDGSPSFIIKAKASRDKL